MQNWDWYAYWVGDAKRQVGSDVTVGRNPEIPSAGKFGFHPHRVASPSSAHPSSYLPDR